MQVSGHSVRSAPFPPAAVASLVWEARGRYLPLVGGAGGSGGVW